MDRINKFKKNLSEKNIEAYFVGDISNVFYLTGFTGSTAFLIVTETKNYLISDGRYETQIESEVKGDFEIHIVSDYFKAFELLIPKSKNVFIDPGSSLSIYSKISVYCNLIVDSDDIIGGMRVLKDKNEIIEIKESYIIAGRAFKEMLNNIEYGFSENKWAAELEYNMKLLGAKSTSFDTIVASGYRGALPHGIASNKKIIKNEPVIIDFGCKKNYCSDITRVIYSGNDSFVKEIINIVDLARKEAVDVVKPGMKCNEIDAIARNIIDEAGYFEYFNHGLGHSLGINVHENPRFNTKDETVLQEGMVLTIEPGIYLPDKFGIRLEDTVYVTENGCEILSDVLDKRVYEL